jgi:hypothetical protein
MTIEPYLMALLNELQEWGRTYDEFGAHTLDTGTWRSSQRRHSGEAQKRQAW